MCMPRIAQLFTFSMRVFPHLIEQICQQQQKDQRSCCIARGAKAAAGNRTDGRVCLCAAADDDDDAAADAGTFGLSLISAADTSVLANCSTKTGKATDNCSPGR